MTKRGREKEMDRYTEGRKKGNSEKNINTKTIKKEDDEGTGRVRKRQKIKIN